jgi:aspartate/methionine/tyrosine aminotransferase
VLASNPRNPTGQVIEGDELKRLVGLSQEGTTTVILDEFYSWYTYPEREEDFGKCVSAASYVEDVNEDSTVIIDGLTKVRVVVGCSTT